MGNNVRLLSATRRRSWAFFWVRFPLFYTFYFISFRPIHSNFTFTSKEHCVRLIEKVSFWNYTVSINIRRNPSRLYPRQKIPHHVWRVNWTSQRKSIATAAVERSRKSVHNSSWAQTHWRERARIRDRKTIPLLMLNHKDNRLEHSNVMNYWVRKLIVTHHPLLVVVPDEENDCYLFSGDELNASL